MNNRSAFAMLLIAGAVSPALSQDSAIPNYPTRPIAQKYFSRGVWQVSMQTVDNCASKPAATEPLPGIDSIPVVPTSVTTPVNCEIYYPTNLGSNAETGAASGFHHPVIIWGNGAGAVVPGSYGYYLTHLASYGFIVVRPLDGGMLNGEVMLSAARYVVARDSDASSHFAGKVDAQHIGAVGHSQGAIGALNALIKGNGVIKTSISFDIPISLSCPGGTCIDPARLASARNGSALFMSGQEDPISPDTQPIVTGVNSNTAWYNSVPLPTKAKAMLVGASHHDMFGAPACNGLPLCNNGVYGFLGYSTAWLMWQLRGAEDGRAAFKAGDGEIFSDRTNWSGATSNVQ